LPQGHTGDDTSVAGGILKKSARRTRVGAAAERWQILGGHAADWRRCCHAWHTSRLETPPAGAARPLPRHTSSTRLPKHSLDALAELLSANWAKAQRQQAKKLATWPWSLGQRGSAGAAMIVTQQLDGYEQNFFCVRGARRVACRPHCERGGAAAPRVGHDQESIRTHPVSNDFRRENS